MSLRKCATLALALVACAHVAAARDAPTTLYDVVKGMPEVSKAFAKIQEVGLAAQFKNPKLGITAFIPSNAAYDRIAKSINNNPAILDNTQIITQALAYHIINKPLEAKQFAKGLSSHLTALPGQAIAVNSDPKANVFKVGPYNVVESDIKAGKSVVHVIDGFLVAPALMPTLLQALRASNTPIPAKPL